MSDSVPPTLDSAKPSASAEHIQVARRGGIVALGTLASRILGLGRDQVLAAKFSPGDTDIFFLAFVIPNLLRQLFAEGAVQNAVLPVLAQTKERFGSAGARELFRALRGLSLTLLTLVSLAGVLLAPWLVELVAAGFHDRPEDFARTIQLTRWVFPYIFFMGTAALGIAALNVNGRFVVSSFAPGLLNVAFILCALTLPAALHSQGHDPLLALGIGVLFGGVLQVVAQWPSLIQIHYFERPRLDLGNPGLREVLRRMLPVLVGVGIYYVDVVIGRRILSHHEPGSLSYFSFAMRLCDFPQGIFVMALQAASLPSLARLATRDDKRELSETFAFGLRLSLFVALPASALLMVLSEPIVVTIFQRGAFAADAARQTAWALIAQAAGIWMVACVRQFAGLYYALGDTRTPVVVAGLDLLVFIASALTLGAEFGHVGVSIAVTLASFAQMLLLWRGLHKKLGSGWLSGVATSFGSALLAIAPASLAGYAMASRLQQELPDDAWSRLWPGLAGALAFGIVFLLVAWLTHNDDLRFIAQVLGRRRRSR